MCNGLALLPNRPASYFGILYRDSLSGFSICALTLHILSSRPMPAVESSAFDGFLKRILLEILCFDGRVVRPPVAEPRRISLSFFHHQRFFFRNSSNHRDVIFADHGAGIQNEMNSIEFNWISRRHWIHVGGNGRSIGGDGPLGRPCGHALAMTSSVKTNWWIIIAIQNWTVPQHNPEFFFKQVLFFLKCVFITGEFLLLLLLLLLFSFLKLLLRLRFTLYWTAALPNPLDSILWYLLIEWPLNNRIDESSTGIQRVRIASNRIIWKLRTGLLRHCQT